MINTRRIKLSMVRDDSQSSKTSNKKCPVDLHGDHVKKWQRSIMPIFGQNSISRTEGLRELIFVPKCSQETQLTTL